MLPEANLDRHRRNRRLKQYTTVRSTPADVNGGLPPIIIDGNTEKTMARANAASGLHHFKKVTRKGRKAWGLNNPNSSLLASLMPGYPTDTLPMCGEHEKLKKCTYIPRRTVPDRYVHDLTSYARS